MIWGAAFAKSSGINGFCTESCRVVVDLLRRMGLPYITATHDVNNPRSGRVMQAIGMRYCYSYEELWQPKNFPVIFRMYQLNLDGQMTGCIVSIGIAIRCTPPPLLSFGGLFHVEHERGKLRRFASLVFFCGRIGVISRISQARHSRRRAKPRGYAKLGRSSSGGCA